MTRPTLRRPAGRYGRPAGPLRRWLALAALGLLVATGLVLYLLFAVQAANPPLQVGVLRFRTLSEHAVEFRVEVHKPPERAAVCTLRTTSIRGRLVGVGQLVVPPGPKSVVVTRQLATTARGVNGEVAECRLQ